MFHEIPLKLYFMKCSERKASQCILVIKARIHCEVSFVSISQNAVSEAFNET